jgi:hypothetical protein
LASWCRDRELQRAVLRCIVLLLACVMFLPMGCGARGTAAKRTACAPIENGKVAYLSQAARTAEVGHVLFVALGEGEKYLARNEPTDFPWEAISSSDTGVVKPVVLCPNAGVYTVPVRVFAFKAVATGRASLIAPVATAWRSTTAARTHELQAERATITVR